MFIAEKYEEIYPNPINNYVTLAAESFTQSELMAVERKIWRMLGHKLETYPSSYRFFNLFAKLLDLSEEEFNLGNFLLHICMFGFQMLDVKPSLQSISWLIVARSVLSNDVFDKVTYKEEDLEIVFKNQKYSKEGIGK